MDSDANQINSLFPVHTPTHPLSDTNGGAFPVRSSVNSPSNNGDTTDHNDSSDSRLRNNPLYYSSNGDVPTSFNLPKLTAMTANSTSTNKNTSGASTLSPTSSPHFNPTVGGGSPQAYPTDTPHPNVPRNYPLYVPSITSRQHPFNLSNNSRGTLGSNSQGGDSAYISVYSNSSESRRVPTGNTTSSTLASTGGPVSPNSYSLHNGLTYNVPEALSRPNPAGTGYNVNSNNTTNVANYTGNRNQSSTSPNTAGGSRPDGRGGGREKRHMTRNRPAPLSVDTGRPPPAQGGRTSPGQPARSEDRPYGFSWYSPPIEDGREGRRDVPNPLYSEEHNTGFDLLTSRAKKKKKHRGIRETLTSKKSSEQAPFSALNQVDDSYSYSHSHSHTMQSNSTNINNSNNNSNSNTSRGNSSIGSESRNSLSELSHTANGSSNDTNLLSRTETENKAPTSTHGSTLPSPSSPSKRKKKKKTQEEAGLRDPETGRLLTEEERRLREAVQYCLDPYQYSHFRCAGPQKGLEVAESREEAVRIGSGGPLPGSARLSTREQSTARVIACHDRRIPHRCSRCKFAFEDSSQLFVCPCGKAHYCSTSCQEADWDLFHHKICRYGRTKEEYYRSAHFTVKYCCAHCGRREQDMEEEVVCEFNLMGWFQYLMSCGRSWFSGPGQSYEDREENDQESEKDEERRRDREMAQLPNEKRTRQSPIFPADMHVRSGRGGSSRNSSRRSTPGSHLSDTNPFTENSSQPRNSTTSELSGRSSRANSNNGKLIGRIKKLRRKSAPEEPRGTTEGHEYSSSSSGRDSDYEDDYNMWNSRGVTQHFDEADAYSYRSPSTVVDSPPLEPTRRASSTVDGGEKKRHILLNLPQLSTVPPSSSSVFPIKLKRCVCNEVFYCSTSCQKGDWPTHKYVCRALQRDVEQDWLGKSTEEMSVCRTVLQQNTLVMSTSLFDRVVQEQNKGGEASAEGKGAVVRGGGTRRSSLAGGVVKRDVGTQTAPSFAAFLPTPTPNPKTVNVLVHSDDDTPEPPGLKKKPSKLAVDQEPDRLGNFVALSTQNSKTSVFSNTRYEEELEVSDVTDSDEEDHHPIPGPIFRTNTSPSGLSRKETSPPEDDDDDDDDEGSFYKESHKKSLSRIFGVSSSKKGQQAAAPAATSGAGGGGSPAFQRPTSKNGSRSKLKRTVSSISGAKRKKQQGKHFASLSTKAHSRVNSTSEYNGNSGIEGNSGTGFGPYPATAHNRYDSLMLSTFLKANQSSMNLLPYINHTNYTPNNNNPQNGSVLDPYSPTLHLDENGSPLTVAVNSPTHLHPHTPHASKKGSIFHRRSHTFDTALSPTIPSLQLEAGAVPIISHHNPSVGTGSQGRSATTTSSSSNHHHHHNNNNNNNKSLMFNSTVFDDMGLSSAMLNYTGTFQQNSLNGIPTTSYHGYSSSGHYPHAAASPQGHFGNVLVEYTIGRKKILAGEQLERNRLLYLFQETRLQLSLERVEKEEEWERRRIMMEEIEWVLKVGRKESEAINDKVKTYFKQ